jgi:hypothetical protein
MNWLTLLLLVFSFNTYGLTQTIVGGDTKVTLLPQHIILLAKIDTGADSASLDARQIKLYRRANQQWVHFKVPLFDGCLQNVSYPILRWAKIKNRTHEHAKARPVILIRVQIGSVTRTIETNLTNRQHFKYRLLLGKNAIKTFHFLIDLHKAVIQ